MIDAEAVATAWLDAGDIDAPVLGRRPASLDAPWVQVTLIDDVPDRRSPALHLSDSFLQFDCYAGADGGQVEAADLADAVRARLHEMPGVHAGGVVTAVTGLVRRRLADTELQPARERYVVTATVTGHG